MSQEAIHDLAIVGGGINGAGIACDAAGRGLKVLLIEAGDLGGGTSSASTKLVHGGLRYLEHYQFRLVRESLAEREALLTKAPHIVWPLRFALPHVPGMRSRWLLRAGLFLYDRLHRRRSIPGSRAVDLRRDPAGRPLTRGMDDGFAYWDCWVDDARLVVLNARAAVERGAAILTRTRFEGAYPADGHWRLALRDQASGYAREMRAHSLVNAAGPWAAETQGLILAAKSVPSPARRPRLIKGSHIVVPRIAGADCAYLLQNPDGRVVFVLPFEERFSLIGTTEMPFDGDPGAAHIEPEEMEYLLASVGRFFAEAPTADSIVWTFAGVRPLTDDGNDEPSAISRDYRLEFAVCADRPPLLTVHGGKLTTYRRLAEKALQHLAPHLPSMRRPWTAGAPLPGGDMDSFDAFVQTLAGRRPRFDPAFLRRLARRHGSRTEDVLGDARDKQGLGRPIGADLYEREVAYFKAQEWARHPDDVLWRRTKTGLHLSIGERARAAEAIAALL